MPNPSEDRPTPPPGSAEEALRRLEAAARPGVRGGRAADGPGGRGRRRQPVRRQPLRGQSGRTRPRRTRQAPAGGLAGPRGRPRRHRPRARPVRGPRPGPARPRSARAPAPPGRRAARAAARPARADRLVPRAIWSGAASRRSRSRTSRSSSARGPLRGRFPAPFGRRPFAARPLQSGHERRAEPPPAARGGWASGTVRVARAWRALAPRVAARRVRLGWVCS